MGRSSSRSSARTCPRCAALLLTDATSCGICRFDLTAPPVAEPAQPAPVEAVEESIDAAPMPTADTEGPLDIVESPVVEAPVAEAPVVEAPATDPEASDPHEPESPAAEAPVFEAPVFAAPVFEAPVFEAPVDTPVVEPLIDESAGQESAVVDAPTDAPTEPATHAPTHAPTDEAPQPLESHTLFAPAPFETPDEPETQAPEPDAAAAAAAMSAPAPTFDAPAPHVARHGRPDARGVQAPQGLSSAVLILGVLRVASLALSIVLAWWAVQQVQSVLDAVFTVDATGEPNLDGFNSLNAALATAGFSALVGLVSAGISIAFLVCLMVWTSRARTVAAITSTGEHRFSPTWAVLGWIVPFANVVVPFLVLTDLQKSADPKTSQTRGRFSGSVPAEIALLWVTWVASFVLAIVQLTSRNSSIASGVGISPFSSLQWVWLLVTVISTALMIVVVRRITALQATQLLSAVTTEQAATRVGDPRFGSEWHDTAPVPLIPTYDAPGAPFASSAPVGAGVNATQAYEPPPMSSAPATPLPSSSSLDQARINPRDPFSFPPPGPQG